MLYYLGVQKFVSPLPSQPSNVLNFHRALHCSTELNKAISADSVSVGIDSKSQKNIPTSQERSKPELFVLSTRFRIRYFPYSRYLCGRFKRTNIVKEGNLCWAVSNHGVKKGSLLLRTDRSLYDKPVRSVT